MEVKVQYVVDLEEIPGEVQKLLPPGEDLEDRIYNLNSLVGEQSFSLALDEIEGIRKSMYKIDQRLADCQAILKGYLGVKSGQIKQEQEATQPQDNFTDVDLEQLKNLTSMFQPSEETTNDSVS